MFLACAPSARAHTRVRSCARELVCVRARVTQGSELHGGLRDVLPRAWPECRTDDVAESEFVGARFGVCLCLTPRSPSTVASHLEGRDHTATFAGLANS
jgi:hypothetical protein